MNILGPDLNKDRPAFGQKILGDSQPITKVREIRVDAALPVVAEGPDLLDLSRQILKFAIFDVSLPG